MTEAERLARRALLERYLLGTLDEGARAVLRAQVIGDPDVFDEVREVELDLLDDLARGTLDPERRRLVESRLIEAAGNEDAWLVAQALAARTATARSSRIPFLRPKQKRAEQLGPNYTRLTWWPLAATVLITAGLTVYVYRYMQPAPGQPPVQGPAVASGKSPGSGPSTAPSGPTSSPPRALTQPGQPDQSTPREAGEPGSGTPPSTGPSSTPPSGAKPEMPGGGTTPSTSPRDGGPKGPRAQGPGVPAQGGRPSSGLPSKGPSKDGVAPIGPHREGPRQEGPRQEGPRQEGIVALYLPSAVLRGSRPSIHVAPATRTVRLDLELPASTPDEVDVALRAVPRGTVWSADTVRVTRQDGQPALSLSVPADRLPTGPIEVVVTPHNRARAIASTAHIVPFTVTRD